MFFLFSPDCWTVLTEKDFIFLEAVLKGRYLPGLSYFTMQSTSCQNSLWVWGTNWMQCNFLSFKSNSGLNGHIIRLKPDVKAWNNHSIWCWDGYSLILSDSIWTLTNLHVSCCSFISLWQFWVWIKLLRSSDSS